MHDAGPFAAPSPGALGPSITDIASFYRAICAQAKSMGHSPILLSAISEAFHVDITPRLISRPVPETSRAQAQPARPEPESRPLDPAATVLQSTNAWKDAQFPSREHAAHCHDRPRAYIGLKICDIPPASLDGVTVFATAPGGPADTAGIREGDIITSINGHAVSSPAEFWRVLATCAAGQHIPIERHVNGRGVHVTYIHVLSTSRRTVAVTEARSARSGRVTSTFRGRYRRTPDEDGFGYGL